MADLVALSPSTPHPGSLAAAADAFLDRVDVAATTRRVYRASLAALVHGLGPARAMPELTAKLVDDWFRPATPQWRRRPGTGSWPPSGRRSPGGGPTAGWPPTLPPALPGAGSTPTEPGP